MTPKQQRVLLALCREMVEEFEALWLAYGGPGCQRANRRYSQRLDRLTKRKGKK